MYKRYLVYGIHLWNPSVCTDYLKLRVLVRVSIRLHRMRRHPSIHPEKLMRREQGNRNSGEKIVAASLVL